MRWPMKAASLRISNSFRLFLGGRQKIASDWEKSGSPMPAPQAVKLAVLLRYSVTNHPWIETGTYPGERTQALARVSPMVLSLEPDRKLYLQAINALRPFQNVEVLNLTSGEGLEPAIAEMSGEGVNFWLDAHYPRGKTFRGTADTPVLHELGVISRAIEKKVILRARVFVDNVRLFVWERWEDTDDSPGNGYPSLTVIISFVLDLGYKWTIEHDILVIWME